MKLNGEREEGIPEVSFPPAYEALKRKRFSIVGIIKKSFPPAYEALKLGVGVMDLEGFGSFPPAYEALKPACFLR